MRVSKLLIYANLTALTLNGVMLCLMAVKAFPPLLGMVLIMVFLCGSVCLSCYLNGQLPKRTHGVPFHAAPTRKVMCCAVSKYVDKKNRPNQQTFCCQVCHAKMHADLNASRNIAARVHDEELRACVNRQDVKALLMRRHEQWKQAFRLVVVQPPAQLGLWEHPEDGLTASTGVG